MQDRSRRDDDGLPRFLSIDEVAQLLRLNRKTVILAIERKQLRARKFGRIWRIPRAALDEAQPEVVEE